MTKPSLPERRREAERLRRDAGPSVYEDRAPLAPEEGWTPVGEFGPMGEFIPARPDPLRSPAGWVPLDGLLRDRAT